ncbi:WhiB family transcriptional regulator [Streptomyces sp. NPDC058220]|uniref:WhiB family transcriptional regulator n=1 Tax=Streptomyces sp. NPDC058220 TaxID=3346387 RepID=UPI0036E357DA
MSRAPDTLPGRYDWHAAGRCLPKPDLFFADFGGSADRARSICAACPIQLLCLNQAMEQENGLSYTYRHGVWGGLTPRERADRDRVTTQVPRGPDAPPKKTRPGGKRPLAPCGTRTAYERHQQRGEAIDAACADAYETYREGRRKPAQCGTRGGYSKHLRERTAICDPCRAANTAANRRLCATGTSKVAA